MSDSVEAFEYDKIAELLKEIEERADRIFSDIVQMSMPELSAVPETLGIGYINETLSKIQAGSNAVEKYEGIIQLDLVKTRRLLITVKSHINLRKAQLSEDKAIAGRQSRGDREDSMNRRLVKEVNLRTRIEESISLVESVAAQLKSRKKAVEQLNASLRLQWATLKLSRETEGFIVSSLPANNHPEIKETDTDFFSQMLNSAMSTKISNGHITREDNQIPIIPLDTDPSDIIEEDLKIDLEIQPDTTQESQDTSFMDDLFSQKIEQIEKEEKPEPKKTKQQAKVKEITTNSDILIDDMDDHIRNPVKQEMVSFEDMLKNSNPEDFKATLKSSEEIKEGEQETLSEADALENLLKQGVDVRKIPKEKKIDSVVNESSDLSEFLA